MVLKDAELREQLNRFFSYVNERVQVHAFILFGSYARGTPREWSDIDVAVISPEWTGMSRQERMLILGRWAWYAGAHWVEPVGYTPSELARALPNSFVGDIRDKGVYFSPEDIPLPWSE